MQTVKHFIAIFISRPGSLRKRFFTITIAALLLSITDQAAHAQSEMPKLELGAQFSAIRLSDFRPTRRGSSIYFSKWEVGVGGRATYNFNSHLAVEGEVNFFFPEDSLLRGNLRTEGLFGVKAGKRWDRFGLFGKLRPGFMISEAMCLTKEGRAARCSEPVPRENNVALDLGFVLEVYTSRRYILRLDVGDTLIRDRRPRKIIQNPQITLGVGFRF